jgi:coenzyme F420-dependent glucose-6-phosphate dehydrogenase
MTLYSYHVSQEQFDPSELLAFARAAEEAGFDALFTSDHLQPWLPEQGQSAFSWAWMGAALQATRRIGVGTITVPGGWRYQPVVLAQAIGTLAKMFPARLPWIAFGSGEALNEALTGQPWPDKPERNRRLREGVQTIRRLLDGERVTAPGPPGAQDARLWCRPSQRPRLVGAALSEATARWLGTWAEGLLTTAPTADAVAPLVRAFRESAGDELPVHLKVDISWAPTEDEALAQAHAQWRFSAVDAATLAECRQPEAFAQAALTVPPETLRRHVFVSHDLDAHIAHLRAFAALGVASIDIHQVGRDQRGFIEAFGARVLPALRGRRASV